MVERLARTSTVRVTVEGKVYRVEVLGPLGGPEVVFGLELVKAAIVARSLQGGAALPPGGLVLTGRKVDAPEG